jgi:hypothetical protein
MEEIFITEEELKYLTDIPLIASEGTVSYGKSKLNFEEEAKGCITLEQFSRMWDDSIRRLIPNP